MVGKKQIKILGERLKMANENDTQTLEDKVYDTCVSCNAVTPYTKDTPIIQREGYVEGAGQLCKGCNTSIYGDK